MTGSTFMESSPFLLLFLLGYCLAVIEGELRCYCNESGCVSTGYMCKSSAGQCFTAVEIRGEATHQTHGCLDSLPKEHQASCKIGVDVISTSKTDMVTGHFPFLLCCTEHMCNYREDIDISIILTPKYNGTFHRGSAPASEDSAYYSRNHHSTRDDNRELWFKAAVIAVPIAGGFILVLLVLLAVRMLRTDTRHHRRLIHIHRERSLTKAHMYISEHFSNKGDKQHFSLFNEKTNNTSANFNSDTIAVGTNNGNTHTSSSPCQPSCLGDSLNGYCSYSLRKDITHKPDSSSRGINSNNHCHTSLPCSNTSHVICLPRDSQSGTTSNIDKPCSFYISPSSKNSCLTRDTSIKMDMGFRVHPHASRPNSNETHSDPGYQHPSVASWDGACLKGPTAVV